MSTKLNTEALTAMVHYVTRAYSAEPEKLGAVRLHKILWNTEVQAVRRTGYPVAGETFIKHKHGPFAEHLDDVVDALKRARLLHVVEPDDEYKPRLYIGKGSPDRSLLTNEQWQILDQIMQRIVEDHTAGTISERSHGDVWEATEMYGPMPVDAEAIRFVKPPKDVEENIAEQITSLKC